MVGLRGLKVLVRDLSVDMEPGGRLGFASSSESTPMTAGNDGQCDEQIRQVLRTLPRKRVDRRMCPLFALRSFSESVSVILHDPSVVWLTSGK